MADPWTALLRQHAQQLPDFSALDADAHSRLHDLVAATIEREVAALDTALEHALSFVPRLLRGPVKKLVSL